ncbi:hypothetical protein I3843_08G083200 [Carya illinoinensis]|nr:hypothetical protein I3843_08G083200 [Carya illinoinensis]
MGSSRAIEDCLGWAARDESGVLSPYKFSRRAVGGDDVSIKITHCRVCYGDVFWTRNKYGDAKYPVVPGHEIAGIVKEIGSNVRGFKVGDHVGVGFYVSSCRDCPFCNDALEVHCEKGAVHTFNGIDIDGTITKGGYSNYTVVHERQTIYFYSPMIRYKMNEPGKSLGVIGLGGLGHMAVKFGKTFGLNVIVFNTSISKRGEALSLLNVDKFVISSDQHTPAALLASLDCPQTEPLALTKSFDFIIDTASGDHPFDAYMSLLKTAGVLVLVGAPSEVKVSPASLLLGMKTITGSQVGGTKDTREMINICATHKIYPEIEVIPIQYVNEAIERLIKSDVKYRFVIDIENSLK